MTEPKAPFATVEEAVEEIRQGRMIVLVDDEDRENEGDLTMAADSITPEAINFMTKIRPRPHLPFAHRAALRRPRPAADFTPQHVSLRHPILRAHRRQARDDDGD